MNDWLDVMLEEIDRKKKALLEATEEHRRRCGDHAGDDEESVEVAQERVR